MDVGQRKCEAFAGLIVSDDGEEERRDAANEPSVPRMFQKDTARLGRLLMQLFQN